MKAYLKLGLTFLTIGGTTHNCSLRTSHCTPVYLASRKMLVKHTNVGRCFGGHIRWFLECLSHGFL
jgi:hypothetical protein